MSKMLFKPLVTTLFVAATCLSAAYAQNKSQADVKGSSDHPLIKRFAGSALVGYRAIPWDQTQLPIGSKVDNRTMKETVTVEGKITRLIYVTPAGKSPLEVYRNYEQALASAGFKKIFVCDKGKECSNLYFAWGNDSVFKGMAYAEGSIPTADGRNKIGFESAFDSSGRFLYGTIKQGGVDVHVMLYNGIAVDERTEATATFIEIVEPKAMQTGQVIVDAAAMQKGLLGSGKIALYGMYFDTGKAEVKAESKAKLDEIAKLLQAQPTIKVYIVGHTDNQGQLDANLALSQQRAQAVIGALAAAPYKIDAKRLIAKGVANLAPVESNEADAGRAKNRRVELVLQ